MFVLAFALLVGAVLFMAAKPTVTQTTSGSTTVTQTSNTAKILAWILLIVSIILFLIGIFLNFRSNPLPEVCKPTIVGAPATIRQVTEIPIYSIPTISSTGKFTVY